MPRVKQKASRSLKELCLQSISCSIDSLWCREFLEKYHGKAHYLFVLGRLEEGNWLKLQNTFIRSLWWSATELNPWHLVGTEAEEVTEKAPLLPLNLPILEKSQFVSLWREPGSELTAGPAEMLPAGGAGLVSQQTSRIPIGVKISDQIANFGFEFQ